MLASEEGADEEGESGVTNNKSNSKGDMINENFLANEGHSKAKEESTYKVKVNDDEDFPPLISNSFDFWKQRETITAILQPSIMRAYHGTFKEIMKLIQRIEDSGTVIEMIKIIIMQLGDKYQQLMRQSWRERMRLPISRFYAA